MNVSSARSISTSFATVLSSFVVSTNLIGTPIVGMIPSTTAMCRVLSTNPSLFFLPRIVLIVDVFPEPAAPNITTTQGSPPSPFPLKAFCEK
jgi:hypothetical protein